MEMVEIVMNPVRQRIFQYFLLHETGTVKELRKALPDVPGASLYRHVKILTGSSILTVVGENRIRSASFYFGEGRTRTVKRHVGGRYGYLGNAL